VTQNLTDPRPRIRDRFVAAWRAFRDPNRACIVGVRLGVQMYPAIAAGVREMQAGAR
jgi:hypothetical protein